MLNRNKIKLIGGGGNYCLFAYDGLDKRGRRIGFVYRKRGEKETRYYDQLTASILTFAYSLRKLDESKPEPTQEELEHILSLPVSDGNKILENYVSKYE